MWDDHKQMWRNSLPQGSPASPLLSNIVCQSLDESLSNLAKRYGLTYTRYADDMTFSSNHSVYAQGGKFLEEVRSIVTSHGFQINDKKTRLQKKGSRQEVTGVIINDKINTYREYRKNLRAAVFHAETNGCTPKEYNNIMGRISYLSMVRGQDDSMSRKFAAIMSKVSIRQ
jgi:retron-type reverse transcriptase